MPSALEHQRAAAALILGAIGDDAFALAGSGAIREHGVILRATQDIDLFTNDTGIERFASAVQRAVATLTGHGYQAVLARSAAQFARLAVTAVDGYQFEVDLGVDWRAHDPVRLEVGPVLALEDAIANKIGALYSRAAARDYIDVDAIRRSGPFSDAQLLQLAAEHDPGFDPVIFAEQLDHVAELRAATFAEYDVTPEHLQALQQRLQAWRQQILRADTNNPANTADSPERHESPRTDPRREPPPHPDRPPPGFSI
ncbi:MAG: nucleotidyl transferase AbiEii/AbiGii toxin family protein [Dermatophilaceae bacterium]